MEKILFPKLPSEKATQVKKMVALISCLGHVTQLKKKNQKMGRKSKQIFL